MISASLFFAKLALSHLVLLIMAKELQEGNCYVALTHDHLDSTSMIDRVRSPKAGAIVMFAGKTPFTLVAAKILML